MDGDQFEILSDIYIPIYVHTYSVLPRKNRITRISSHDKWRTSVALAAKEPKGSTLLSSLLFVIFKCQNIVIIWRLFSFFLLFCWPLFGIICLWHWPLAGWPPMRFHIFWLMHFLLATWPVSHSVSWPVSQSVSQLQGCCCISIRRLLWLWLSGLLPNSPGVLTHGSN